MRDGAGLLDGHICSFVVLRQNRPQLPIDGFGTGLPRLAIESVANSVLLDRHQAVYHAFHHFDRCVVADIYSSERDQITIATDLELFKSFVAIRSAERADRAAFAVRAREFDFERQQSRQLHVGL